MSDDVFAWLQPGLEKIRAGGMERRLKVGAGASLSEMELDGRRIVQFASNNYLGLATHPRVLDAAEKALRRFGAQARAGFLCRRTQVTKPPGAARLITYPARRTEGQPKPESAFVGLPRSLRAVGAATTTTDLPVQHPEPACQPHRRAFPQRGR